MKAQASGADRWRRDSGAEWKRQELAESGNLPGGSLRIASEGTVSLAHVAVAKIAV